MVDADSCPVKQEIVEIASNFSLGVTFVASYNHMSATEATGTWKYVDTGKEAVDLYIMNHVVKGDFAVTQDIGLASTLLNKGVYVLSPRGNVYEEKDINLALEMRYLAAKARRQGVHSKGPKRFGQKDRDDFVKNFYSILSKFAGNL